MSTYSEMKSKLDEIANELRSYREATARAKGTFTQVSNDLSSLAENYSGIIADINTFAENNSTDVAANVLKAEQDLLLAEYLELKTTIDTLVSNMKL